MGWPHEFGIPDGRYFKSSALHSSRLFESHYEVNTESSSRKGVILEIGSRDESSSGEKRSDVPKPLSLLSVHLFTVILSSSIKIIATSPVNGQLSVINVFPKSFHLAKKQDRVVANPSCGNRETRFREGGKTWK